MRTIVLLALGLAAIEAVPSNLQRIVGGTQTNINTYPFIAAMLFSGNFVSYMHACGGSIIASRSVLTAAHCVVGDPVLRWRIRVGSSLANSGGVIHMVDRIVTHGAYNFAVRWNNDIAIVGTSTSFTFNNSVRGVQLAGSNYNLPDNVQVWTAGWGITSLGGTKPDQLRHVEILTVDHERCRASYAATGYTVLRDTMVCAGLFFYGGHGPCDGDSGGPLLHNGIAVGIVSWGRECALPQFPGIFTRISNYPTWIANNV